jgi:hypothetical protein
MNTIAISVATLKDIQGMISVRHDTWLSTKDAPSSFIERYPCL